MADRLCYQISQYYYIDTYWPQVRLGEVGKVCGKEEENSVFVDFVSAPIFVSFLTFFLFPSHASVWLCEEAYEYP
jgi:hypothetical protein